MRPTPNFIPTLLVAVFLLTAWAVPTHAVVRIYKVTFTAKALLFPASHSFKDVGYVIYDTNAPANSQTVQVFSNRTYQVNGSMLQDVFPAQIGLQPADRLPAPAGDTINDTEFALISFNNGNIFHARSLIGAIPRRPFAIGATIFINTSKSLKGKGSLTNRTFDHFTVTEAWTIDALSSSNPVDTNSGTVLVTAMLAGKGYTQVP